MRHLWMKAVAFCWAAKAWIAARKAAAAAFFILKAKFICKLPCKSWSSWDYLDPICRKSYFSQILVKTCLRRPPPPPLLVFPSLQLSSTNANASRIQIFSSFSHYHYLTSFCCVDISIRTAAVDPKQKKGMEAGASLTSICKNFVVPTVLEKGHNQFVLFPF